MKNNLEEVWNQEYKDFMLSFYPESSPLVSTWEIYRMAKIKSQRGIESIRTQLLAQCKISRELLVEKEQLEQELQKTRDQLNKCELALNNYAICDDVGNVARRYFKDKQGKSK